MGNLSIIEMAVIGLATYFGFAKNPFFSGKIAVFVMGAIFLLIFLLGGGTDSPLSGFGLTVNNINFAMVGIVGVMLFMIYKRYSKDENPRGLWLILAAVLLLSALSGGLNF